jgi:hypothetical protein
MDEIFVESTLWIGLLVSLLMTIGFLIMSFKMNGGKLWRWFTVAFFLLFFVLPIIDAIWNIF